MSIVILSEAKKLDDLAVISDGEMNRDSSLRSE